MKTIKLLVELTYDEDLMHGEDPESIRWFRDEILMCESREDLLLHSNEIGDTVGSIRVLQLPEEVERSEEFTAGKMRMLADVQDQLEENTRVYIRTRDYWEGRTRKLEDELDEVYRALARAARLFEEALPKFNWGASALDANAIQLLNEVPGEVRAALKACALCGGECHTAPNCPWANED